MKNLQTLDEVIKGHGLYAGNTWREAINHTLERFNNPIKPIYAETIVNNDINFYQITIKDKGRAFKLDIPSQFNDYVKSQLNKN